MTVSISDWRKRIPVELLKRIDQIEAWLATEPPDAPGEKIAVFDLDNTLLIGDIGDALYVELKNMEKQQPVTVTGAPLPFSWGGYQDFLAENGKEVAYKAIVSALAGVPLDTVIAVTRRIMGMWPGTEFLYIEGKAVPVPRVNPVMHALIKMLQGLGYGIFVISATVQPVVRSAAKSFFDIPHSHAFGMVPTLTTRDSKTILGNEIKGPVTVTEGKVKVYENHISKHPPLISGGDSPTDIPMLKLTHEKGLIISLMENDFDDDVVAGYKGYKLFKLISAWPKSRKRFSSRRIA